MPLLYRPEAAAEVEQAHDWYERQQTGWVMSFWRSSDGANAWFRKHHLRIE
jgi:heme-degrading monooxygenase HmoA